MLFAITLVNLALASIAQAVVDVSDFDWATVQPSDSLNYTQCYDNHKCAKLRVPLDWLHPVDNEARVTLAIITRPATVDDTDPSFGGTVIFNPGGPSGSGVDVILRAGKIIQQTADGEKKYEILSFDPRGVGLTTPNADCFRNEFARGNIMLEDRAIGPLDGGSDILRRRMSRAKAFGQLCHTENAREDIRNFMSTASVARDMVEIVDKLDELRNDNFGPSEVEADGEARLELRSATRKDVPRIQYWGYSYGTVLGNYFASMFPGRIGRMILEAVEDPQDYTNATWAFNMRDTQQAFDHLWDSCFEAGSRCPLYESSDKAPGDIATRFAAFLDELDSSPVSYVSQGSIISISKQDVLDVIFGPIYQPLREFPRLADTLADAMGGNFTLLYQRLGQPDSNSCPLLIPQTYTWNLDAEFAIACGDGHSQTNMTLAEFEDYVSLLKADSPDFGPSWSGLRLGCTGWDFRPKYRFTGPWETPAPDSNLVEGKPAAPILFISSLIDPVTPLANAIKASKSHPGSSVVVQNNVGHGTLFSPSKCKEDHVKRYLETGEVPPADITICSAECQPFQDCARAADVAMTQSTSASYYRGRRPPLALI